MQRSFEFGGLCLLAIARVRPRAVEVLCDGEALLCICADRQVPARAAGTRPAPACSRPRRAVVPRQVPRRRRLRLQGEQLGVPDRRAVRRRHPPFRRRLAARDRGRGDDPRRAPALHASGEVAPRDPPRLCARRALVRARRRGRAREDHRGDGRRARSAAVGAHRRAGDQQPHPARAQVRPHRREGRPPARQDAAGRGRARPHLPRRLADDDAGRLSSRRWARCIASSSSRA